ncbi:uncharacterized protein LOC106142730 [Amyelois transitella]|uniref:uncharacterized protein LOC106142730 n=1 Tax=Amyelois transitella TaxID=680683 RepID=UPI0029905CF1|nr:uncharacterized protein LOC106142730 [Amyelois transitella]XP_060808212.1 uncharacterized protein LOC106142730 [Amyelois transitella]XP_060808213.1 uncharacterized protein LOC106142730 [Amyelois transitella]XP_060808214.1 uncharacterized protein LOC106142730 [Amyelois transitella]XP_060808215.1 uncharacterized protein LOC106142730 [Amyelois transitella]
MAALSSETPGSGSDEYMAGVRLVVLNLPEDEGEGLGFRLTRTLWDPYPWVREVTPGARADSAGLKTGDCLLQADGRDLLGLPVGQVAGLIRGDGAGRGVSLLVWNCGVDPRDDPELLWSCGGGARGERSRRALAGAVRALACCVCAATAARPLVCARSHLYCEACWSRLEKCALCRETLPAKDSPYARNLVAEQVFEAIATEYELKDTFKRPTETVSAYNTPNRSPNMSPAAHRKGQYRLSSMTRKKVQFNEKLGQSYGSDPNLLRTSEKRTTNLVENNAGNSSCQCDSGLNVPKINVTECGSGKGGCCQNLQHKLVTRLRPACSLADLQNVALQPCHLSKSLNSLGDCKTGCLHTGSLDNLKNSSSQNIGDHPVFVVSPPPIYVLSCDHTQTK